MSVHGVQECGRKHTWRVENNFWQSALSFYCLLNFLGPREGTHRVYSANTFMHQSEKPGLILQASASRESGHTVCFLSPSTWPQTSHPGLELATWLRITLNWSFCLYLLSAGLQDVPHRTWLLLRIKPRVSCQGIQALSSHWAPVPALSCPSPFCSSSLSGLFPPGGVGALHRMTLWSWQVAHKCLQ